MPRRAALDALSALFTLLITPERLSDLALSHSSPSSHHHHSLSIAPKSPSHSKSHPAHLPEGTHGTLGPAGPRRAAPRSSNPSIPLLAPC